MKKNHLHNRRFFGIVFVLMLSALFAAGAVAVHAETAPVTYISSAEEFKNAVIGRQEIIYVDDITFDTPETVVVNGNVEIIGKNKKSTIKNLHIQIHGSEIFENKIKLSLKNIVFDGCFDITKYDITQEKPFDEVFGAENDNSFLSTEENGIGYYDIDISDCEFTNYSGWWGAVISLPSNKSENGDKTVSIKNSRFYGNVGAERIVDIYDRHIKLNLENVEMFDNHAISKMANLSNVSVEIDGLHIHDNHFIPLDSAEYSTQRNDMNMIRGGGIYFGNARGIVKNMTVENGETYYGGGMFLALGIQGDKKLVFADCTFKDNKAKIYGGAVAVESYVGYPVYFTNCQFQDNSAPKGASLCAMPFFWDKNDGNTSLIEFSFCDFSGNTADDDRAFEYYYDGFPKTKKDGRIVVKACRIEDATFLCGNGEKENGYNIVSPTAMTNIFEGKVPAEEYTKWAKGYYSGATGERTIGYTELISHGGRLSPLQPILYGVCLVLSVAIALFYYFKSTEKHMEMILIGASVAIINIGYLLLSVSGNITTALIFNNIAYLGNALLPLFFTMAVANVCRYKLKKGSKVILSAVTAVNFLFTLTVWFSDLFYKEPTYAIINGAVDIVKENGVLHLIYRLYVFAYFLVIFGIVLYSLLKNKLEHKKYAILIFSAEAVCLLVWVVEMFVPVNYELLSAAYALTSLLLSALFFEMEKNGILTIKEIISEVKEEEAQTQREENGSIRIIDAQGIATICQRLVEKGILSHREAEILALLLQGKTSLDISQELFVSKNTVKSHTANIYKKLSVSSREELRTRAISELEG